MDGKAGAGSSADAHSNSNSGQDIPTWIASDSARALDPLATAAAHAAAAHSSNEAMSFALSTGDTDGRIPVVAPTFATLEFQTGSSVDGSAPAAPPISAPDVKPAKRARRSKTTYTNADSGASSGGEGEAKASTSLGGLSSTGRVVKDTKRAEQNRIAQQNFRARKENKIKELEAKAAELAELKIRFAVLEQRERDLVARETALANGSAHALENVALRSQVASLLKSLEELRAARST